MSEDCLHINVWAPVRRHRHETFPVMVWIHGGAFVSGAPEAFGVGNFSVFAVTHRVVVAAASYRVSAFGFFSSELLGAVEPEARCVYGLLDQRLALEWVSDNIDGFGGRPDEVTIYGQSAGGISVSLQTVTPLNEQQDRSRGKRPPLFRAAIASSGYADVLPVTNNTADTNLLAALNCSTVECLYAAPMEAIAAAAGAEASSPSSPPWAATPSSRASPSPSWPSAPIGAGRAVRRAASATSSCPRSLSRASPPTRAHSSSMISSRHSRPPDP
jgi:carboxylesterase type B